MCKMFTLLLNYKLFEARSLSCTSLYSKPILWCLALELPLVEWMAGESQDYWLAV